MIYLKMSDLCEKYHEATIVFPWTPTILESKRILDIGQSAADEMTDKLKVASATSRYLMFVIMGTDMVLALNKKVPKD